MYIHLNLPSSLPNYIRSNALPCLQTPSPKKRDMDGVSFAKHRSMSQVAGYRAANFITMGSPAYNVPPRISQKGPTPPTERQAYAPSNLKKKHHRQHLKETHCPMHHNLIYRPQQSPQHPSTPGNLSIKKLKLK